MSSSIDQLAEYFTQFPGIGPRQAKRFVFFLLKQDQKTRERFIKLLTTLAAETARCADCRRFFIATETQKEQCSVCLDPGRNKKQLMLVEKDMDLENIERAGVYDGRYFVLGGTVPALATQPSKDMQIAELKAYVKENGPEEIICAFAANPEGDMTVQYVKQLLKPLAEKQSFTFSLLGRGLSTGSELEYSDAETIKMHYQIEVNPH